MKIIALLPKKLLSNVPSWYYINLSYHYFSLLFFTGLFAPGCEYSKL